MRVLSFLFLLSGIFIFVNCVALYSQITITQNKDTFQIGDEIIIKYNISKVIINKNIKSAQFIPPVFRETLDNFEVVYSTYDTSANIFILCLRTFETGCLRVPEITFTFETISNSNDFGKLFTRTSEALSVYVIEPDSNINIHSKLKDIPVDLLSESHININIFILFIIVIVAALVIMIAYKNKK